MDANPIPNLAAPTLRRDTAAVLADLPEYCFIRLNTTGEPIIVKRDTWDILRPTRCLMLSG